MRAKLIHDDGPQTFVVVLDHGDEVVAAMERFAAQEKLSGASVSAIGAFSRATLAFFDWETKEYDKIEVPDQVEVVSLNGDIGLDEEGKPALHLHALLSRRDGSTLGGHLLAGEVRPTLEIVVVESPSHLRRRHDRESGLSLIDIPASQDRTGDDGGAARSS